MLIINVLTIDLSMFSAVKITKLFLINRIMVNFYYLVQLFLRIKV